MKLLHMLSAAVALSILGLLVGGWVSASASRARQAVAEKKSGAGQAAVANATDEGYCNGELRLILRRVLTSCGLMKADRGRGCQPLEAKSVAAMSGDDFNALFRPLAQRASIIQFDLDKAELDEPAKALLEETFSDQRGASYFLVVARASPEGSIEHNRTLSEQRANAALSFLKEKFQDPDLEQEVGLLWLGEEFAQLPSEFCSWKLSRSDAECSSLDLNRSAFVAWIDCRL